jgi:hypothetical protein
LLSGRDAIVEAAAGEGDILEIKPDALDGVQLW